jgi:hypothetical protein
MVQAAPLPVPHPAARQPILEAAVTGQTTGQRTKARQAVGQAARKKAATRTKVAKLAEVSTRMPLMSLVAEPTASLQPAWTAPMQREAAQPHWLLQQLEGAAQPALSATDAEMEVNFLPSDTIRLESFKCVQTGKYTC